MKVYNQNYSNLLGELNRLKKELEESLLILKKKENEKKELEQEYDNLIKEIEYKTKEKEKMLNNNTIISIWKIATISVVFIFLLGQVHLSSVYIQTKIPYIYISKVMLECLSIVIVPSIISKYILKMVLKKRQKKIMKSEKYQNLLEDIRLKDEEEKNITKRIKKLSEEYLEATINYSTQNAAVQIKKSEIERLKNTVKDLVSNNYQPEEITKPYTKVKIKSEKNNESY